MSNEYAPPSNLKANPGRDEKALLDRLDDLQKEGDRVKASWVREADLQRDLDLYRGKVKANGSDDLYFDCNFLGAFIDRMVAQLTDNRPIMRVDNKKSGMRKVASGLEKIVHAVWSESDVQREIFKMAHNAAITRSAGMYTGYDSVKDQPVVELLRCSQLTVDPSVLEAGLIDRAAEYVAIERILPIAELKQKYGARGSLVTPDVTISDNPKDHKKSFMSPITDYLGGKPSSRDAIPRARVWEWFVNDRQTGPDGVRLFPAYRRIVRTKDVVLWDGPNPLWDGMIPVDWFDWSVDPEHPWGHSEPARLRRLQLSFNQLMDGLVENQLLTNFITVTGDADAMTPEAWKALERIKSSLIVRKTNRNATLTVTPPPSFGTDKIMIAKQLFTYAQVLTGVMDVTLGDAPGSLQSGLAIEGLQEGANLMTRARASRLEDFVGRVGQKLLSRVMQFVPSDRVFHIFGPTAEAIDYAFNRSELFVNDDGSRLTSQEIRDTMRYMRFQVVPGSSAPGARIARARMMAELMKMGAASRKRVLQAADFPDPDEMIKEAAEDMKNNPAAQLMAKQGGGGGM